MFIPVSFIPKLIKLLAPDLTSMITEHIFKVGKIKESMDYRELPNDADRLGEKNSDQINVVAGEMSMLEDRVKKLEILSDKDGK